MGAGLPDPDASSRAALLPVLRRFKHQVTDFGCDSAASGCDYSDVAAPAARSVAKGENDVAILLEGSGIGMSVTANKIHGVRAALIHDTVTARRAREHHHCNALCIGCELLSEDQIRSITEIFLNATFQDGRHAARVAKVMQIEKEG